MTDSHETNHAAGTGSRHADGIRGTGLSNEQALRKWALQTILLSPHPMPSSWADLERGASRLIAFVETGSSVLPDVRSVVNASFFDRSVQAGNENVGSFKGFQNLGLRALQFGNTAFQFFRSRFHKRSSPFSMLDKKKMGDGGRHDNVSPDSCTVRSPENANDGDVACSQKAEHNICNVLPDDVAHHMIQDGVETLSRELKRILDTVGKLSSYGPPAFYITRSASGQSYSSVNCAELKKMPLEDRVEAINSLLNIACSIRQTSEALMLLDIVPVGEGWRLQFSQAAHAELQKLKQQAG